MGTMERLGYSLDNEYELRLVPPEDGPSFLPILQELADGATFNAPVLYSFEDACRMVSSGRFQLWIARKKGEVMPCLFMITELEQYPQGRVLRLCLMAGRNLRPIVKQFFPTFLEYAKMQNVMYLEANVKPGIAKILRQFGFVKTAIQVNLALVTYN